MTRAELTALEALHEEFRDFRREDAAWKADTSEWRETVTKYIAGAEAVKERDDARGVSRRAYIAAVVAALGTIVSIALFVLNLVLAPS